MKKLARVSAVLAVVCGGMLLASGAAQAAPFNHIDRLALKLRAQSSQLHREFGVHFRHSPNARHLMSDAAALYRRADHLRAVAHSGNLHHMASDLAEMDRLFHHLEELVRDTLFRSRGGRFGHVGHVHGDARHVLRLMNEMGQTLHHLRDDVNQLRRNRPGFLPVQGNRPLVRPAPVSGGGVTIGAGNVQFRIGF